MSKKRDDLDAVSLEENRESETTDAGALFLSKMRSFSGFSIGFESNHSEAPNEFSTDNNPAPRGQEIEEVGSASLVSKDATKVAPRGQEKNSAKPSQEDCGILHATHFSNDSVMTGDAVSFNTKLQQNDVAPRGQVFSIGEFQDVVNELLSEMKLIQKRLWQVRCDDREAVFVLDLMILSQQMNLIKKEIAECFRREKINDDAEAENNENAEAGNLILEFVSVKIIPSDFEAVLNRNDLSERFQFIDGVLRWRIYSKGSSKYCALQIAENEYFLDFVTNMDSEGKRIIQKYESLRLSFMQATVYLKFLINFFFDSMRIEDRQNLFLQRIGYEADFKES